MTDKEKLDLKRKISDYQGELLKWMYEIEDDRGGDRQLADMYKYEDQGDQ